MKENKEKLISKPRLLPPVFDPMGSFTGTPMDPLTVPVQDADDL